MNGNGGGFGGGGGTPLYPGGFNPEGGLLRGPTAPGPGYGVARPGFAGSGAGRNPFTGSPFPGSPFGTPESAGSFAQVPTAGPIASVLSARHGGPRALPQDVPPQPALFDIVRVWHGGKLFPGDKTGDPPHNLPWLTIEVYDVQNGIVIHRIDYLPPSQDDDALTHEIWGRILSTARAYDDAQPHYFAVRCHFTDQNGRMSDDTWMSSSVLIPRQNGDFGAHTGMQARAAIGFGRNHSAPHHAMQEIDMAAMFMHGIDRLMQRFENDLERKDVELARYQAREVTVMELHGELMKDVRREKREEAEFDMKMTMLKNGLERLAPMMSYGGMKIIEYANAKLNAKTPKSAREERSFETLRTILTGLKASGQASTPEKLFATLKMIGIGPDVQNDLMGLLFEIEVDERRRIAEAQTRGMITMQNLLGTAPAAGAPAPGAPAVSVATPARPIAAPAHVPTAPPSGAPPVRALPDAHDLYF